MSRKLIINGVQAEKGRFPYFCSLEHYGGGALIAPDVILTAGHCKPDTYDIDLRIGTFSLKHDTDYESIPIKKMYRNQNWTHYGPDEFRWDYTLIILNETVTGHPYVRMNLNPLLPHGGQMVTAMGLGDTDPFKTPSRANTLRMVNLTAIDNGQCEKAESYHRDISYQGRIHHTHLCTTGGEHNTRDSCNYDSGSPIIIPGQNHEHDLLVGLVSWGVECADPDFPAVNARVSAAGEWIKDIVCSKSVAPPPYLCLPQLPHKRRTIVEVRSVTIGVLIGFLICFIRRRARGAPKNPKEYITVATSDVGSEYSYGSIQGIEIEA